jgi:hypothetical protein
MTGRINMCQDCLLLRILFSFPWILPSTTRPPSTGGLANKGSLRLRSKPPPLRHLRPLNHSGGRHWGCLSWHRSSHRNETMDAGGGEKEHDVEAERAHHRVLGGEWQRVKASRRNGRGTRELTQESVFQNLFYQWYFQFQTIFPASGYHLIYKHISKNAFLCIFPMPFPMRYACKVLKHFWRKNACFHSGRNLKVPNEAYLGITLNSEILRRRYVQKIWVIACIVSPQI